MTEITNERWNQHSTILTLRGEVRKLHDANVELWDKTLSLRHMLDDAATATSELMATAKHWQDRAEAAEKALKICVEQMSDNHPGDDSYWQAVKQAEAALEAKP